MSEFSQSYHLRTEDRGQVISLLKAAGRQGYVFEPANGWVTFAIKDAQFELDEEITRNNNGLLVHYVYFEDHGWSLNVAEGKERVFEYECSWDEEVVFQPEHLHLEVIHRLPTGPKAAINLEELFHITEFEQVFGVEVNPAHQVAVYIGLTHYDWISADYISNDSTFYQGVIEVS